MTYRSLMLACLLMTPLQTYAQTLEMQAEQLGIPEVAAPQTVAPVAVADPAAQSLKMLQDEWAIIKYQTPDEDSQEVAITNLAKKAKAAVGRFPQSNELKVWDAIILATKAGINGGLDALDDAQEAKALLEEVEKVAPRTLDGSVYTSLGSLYFKVPGWPVGFGDNHKAEAYLKKAVAVNPKGIDPNFFYGEFLLDQGKEAEAKAALETALKASARPGREVADAGRKAEVEALLAKISPNS